MVEYYEHKPDANSAFSVRKRRERLTYTLFCKRISVACPCIERPGGRNGAISALRVACQSKPQIVNNALDWTPSRCPLR
jgi:hypothetical protein